METFRKNFSLYSSVLRFTALWPYDRSIRGKIQRVAVIVLLLSILVIQVSTLKFVERSLYNILMLLSVSCPILLMLQRYIGFVINHSLMRKLFDNFSHDYNATIDPIELDIFARQILQAKRVIFVFVGLTIILIGYVTVVLLVPTILHSKMQLQYLQLLGFFYPERSWQSDWASVHFTFIFLFGILSIASTESAVAVTSSYLCGLYEIASYRIEITIENVVISNTSQLIQVRPVLEAQERAAVLLLLVVQQMNDMSNLFISFNAVLYHFIIMYLNNLSGQRMINSNDYIFNTICSSSWYCIPLRAQKMLLFMLMKNAKELRCNIGGLYDLGYKGFSMMMSSSFSYFTVLSSTQ